MSFRYSPLTNGSFLARYVNQIIKAIYDYLFVRFNFVTPEQFGAVGDGVTDDTLALQAAINFGSTNNKEVRLLSKTYLVTAVTGSACLTIPEGGILHMHGAGGTASQIYTNTLSPIIGGIDSDSVHVTGVQFVGSATTARLSWQRGLVLRGVLNAHISGCRFTNLGEGGILLGKTGFGVSDALGDATRQPNVVQITDNIFENIWGTVAVVSKFVGARKIVVSNNVFTAACTVAVSIESEDGAAGTEFAEDVVISGNVVSGCSYLFASGFSNIAGGILLTEQARRAVVSGNSINDITGNTVAWGVSLSSSPAQDDTVVDTVAVSGNVISAVTAVGGRGHGIDISCGDAIIQNFAITGNAIKACSSGIHLAPGFDSGTGEIRSLAITGNTVFDCDEFGIWYDGSGGGSAVALRKPAITGNVVRSCGSHGMSLKMNGGVISGNSCIQNDGIGIVVATGSNSVVVSANYCESNGGSGITGVGPYNRYDANICMNNGQTNSGTYYGIYHSSGAFAEIVNNTCSDNQGSPTQDYGIRGVRGETVRNNLLVGNVSGPIFWGIGAYNTGTYDAGLNRTA